MAVVDPLVHPVYTGTPRFVDKSGQWTLLRGVNIQGDAGASTQNAVVACGGNMARIVVHWDQGENTAPSGTGTTWSSYTHTYNSTYLGNIEAMVSLFASHGIMVQIDSHQASWSPSTKFGGFGGIPAWYYDVAKFPGNAAWTSCSTASNQAGCTIAKFWTETACAQTFYIAWWQELIRRFSAHANVVMYQVFNEPNPGTLGGTSLSKTNTMQTWLAPVVTAMNTADGKRAIAVMNRGGGQGYGTANYQPFGGSAGLQAKNMVIEHHSYYTGLAPGFPASAAGDIGYNAAGDDYFPNSAVCHNTTAGASYTGHEAWQDAYYGVPIAKAQQMGVPLFLGELGVNESDPGRLQYINQMQTMIDAHQLDATVWEMAPTTSGLNLMSASGGTLNDMGLKWQTWFKATDFTPVGGGGGGGSGTLSTNPTNASTVPNFYDPTFTAGSHKGRVEDIVQVAGVVYVAGAFTNVIDVDGSDYTQFSYLCAHRADTGAVIKTWIAGFDARVRKLLVADNGNQIYAVGDFNNAGGSPRHGLARFTALTGPTDTSGIALNLNPGDVSADGSIYDIVVDLPNNRAWVIGGFSNIGGAARRGLAKFTIAAGSGWTLDTAFNFPRAAFVGGGTGRALALKPDGTKLVAGWFPGNNGTDVSTVDSITAHDPNTGSAATWLNPVNYNVTAEEHPGVYEMAGDINGVYITGLHNGGNSVTYYQWNGGGPNALTSQSGQTSDGGSFNAYWYRSSDGNCQSIELISNAGSTLVAVGHHGDVVANGPNAASGTLGSPGPLGNSTSHGLFTCIAGPTGGQDGGYGGPPNFTSPSGSGDNLKLWAIYQEPASGDLLVGGDFTAVNSSAANTYQRYARFAASGGGNSWNPAPSLDDPTPTAGQTINVDPGALTGATGYTYQWQRSPDGSNGSWVNLSGQTSTAYTVAGTVSGTGDVGYFLRAQVVGATPSGNQTQYATATGAVQPISAGPVNTALPVVAPSPAAPNQTLTSTAGTWTPGSGLVFTYTWQRRNVSTGTVATITGASGNTYVTNTTTDVGNQVRSRVSASDGVNPSVTASSAWVDVGIVSTGSAVIYFTSDGHQSNVTKNYPLHGTGADLFVYGGDTYARGTAADFTADVTGLYGASGRDILAKTVVLCGNHDWANRACTGGYFSYIAGLAQHAGFQGSKDYGKLTIAGWDLIFLNTLRSASGITGDCSETATLVSDSSAGVDATQLSWLNAQLAAPGTKKIVFGHHMYLSAGGTGDHPESAMTNFSSLWSALQGKTLAYIHGHWHGYWRMRPRDAQKRVASDTGFVSPGVTDIAAGCAGEGNYTLASTYPAKYIAATRTNPASPQYGYLKITLNGDVATIQIFDQDGVTNPDTYTFTATGSGGGGGGVAPTGGTPTVSDTTPTVSETISCSSGSWSGTQPFDFAFSWEHSQDAGLTWQPALGAGATNAVLNVNAASTTSSYTVDATDLNSLLRCNVTVSNTAGSAPARTAATAAVIDSVVIGQRPLNVTPPTATPRTGVVIGTTLNLSDGSWTGDLPMSFAYKWIRRSSSGLLTVITDGTGAIVTTNTYTVEPVDVGNVVYGVVTATNTTGSTPANSAATNTISSGTGSSITDVIDTADNQTITVGTPFTVIWEGHTDAPGGIVTSQISVDGGAWINGTQVADDGAGGGTWSHTFTTLAAGVHTISTRDIANTV